MITDLESEFVNTFVRKNRRDKMLKYLSDPKSRGKFISELSTKSPLDTKFEKEFSGADRNTGVLPSLFKQAGMGGRVYVISDNPEWDGQKFQMSYIVGECLASFHDTIGYCWKSQTAFYEPHGSMITLFYKKK